MHVIRSFLVFLLVLFVLAGCASGGGAPSSSGSAPSSAPAAAAPSSAPAAAEPTTAAAEGATTAPAAEATTAPFATPPAGAPAAAPTTSITFGTPNTYTQRNGLFSLDTPANWQIQDRSSDTNAEVSATDPTGAATFVARVIPATTNDSSQALPELERYLKETFGAADLTLTPGTRTTDGRLPVEFSYTSMVEGRSIPVSGGGYVANRGNLISFVIYSAPTEQFAFVRNDFQQIADSYQLAPDAQLK